MKPLCGPSSTKSKPRRAGNGLLLHSAAASTKSPCKALSALAIHYRTTHTPSYDHPPLFLPLESTTRAALVEKIDDGVAAAVTGARQRKQLGHGEKRMLQELWSRWEGVGRWDRRRVVAAGGGQATGLGRGNL